MVAQGTPQHSPVLIVGAGPTGLVLALWLTELGIAVRIVDRGAGQVHESRALGVQPRTLELHRQLGIADALVSGGVQVRGANLWVAGRRLARVPLDQVGKGMTPFPSFLVFPQDEHERVLLGRLEALGVEVERNTELTGFDQDADGVSATLIGPDGREQRCEAAFLAGCDGAHSRVRSVLGIAFPGGTYSRLFYVADIEAGSRRIDDEIHIDLDEADLLAVFPLHGERRARLIGTVREHAGEEEGELSFAEVGGRAIEQLSLSVANVNWCSTYHVHHRVAGTFQRGRAFLLGDAGHVHSPVGAQGMNTGIGDAVNLAWKLAAVIRGGAGSELLETYDVERRAFAHRLVATTDRVFTVAVTEGPIAEVARKRIVPIVAPLVMRLAPTRRAFFRTMSQIGVAYRESGLSAGRAGRLHGGDRLPWVRTRGGADNFAPLASMGWQVHVYGKPRAGVKETCSTLRLPLHAFSWRPRMQRAGLRRGALYLVRPDGQIGLAAGDGDPALLRRYVTEHNIGDAIQRNPRTRPAGRPSSRPSDRTGTSSVQVTSR